MTLAENAPSQDLQVDPRYAIDPSKVSELNRSLAGLLDGRRCAECREKLRTQGGGASVAEHVRRIRDCCSKQEGFIQPAMPMQEIIFRTLLAGGNKPLALAHLHNEVTETWYTPMNPRYITIYNVKRVLDNDAYYGFIQVEAA